MIILEVFQSGGLATAATAGSSGSKVGLKELVASEAAQPSVGEIAEDDPDTGGRSLNDSMAEKAIPPIDTKNVFGKTALQWAIQHNDEPRVKALKEAGASLEIEDDQGDTALFYAVEFRRPRSIEFLLAVGANIAHLNHAGDNIILHAARFGYSEILLFLVSRTANLSHINKKQDTVLIVAAKYDQVSVIEWLNFFLEEKFRTQLLEQKNYHGNTALVEAGRYARNSAFKKLIQYNANMAELSAEKVLPKIIPWGSATEITNWFKIFANTSQSVMKKLLLSPSIRHPAKKLYQELARFAEKTLLHEALFLMGLSRQVLVFNKVALSGVRRLASGITATQLDNSLCEITGQENTPTRVQAGVLFNSRSQPQETIVHSRQPSLSKLIRVIKKLSQKKVSPITTDVVRQRLASKPTLLFSSSSGLPHSPLQAWQSVDGGVSTCLESGSQVSSRLNLTDYKGCF